MNPKTGYENLTKVLKNHLAHCKMREFSLQKDRHCTCGVEKAREELAEGRKKVSEFVNDLLESCDWLGGDINGGDFQEICVKHGYLIETTPREPCGDDCRCSEVYSDADFEEGEVTCYRREAE